MCTNVFVENKIKVWEWKISQHAVFEYLLRNDKGKKYIFSDDLYHGYVLA